MFGVVHRLPVMSVAEADSPASDGVVGNLRSSAANSTGAGVGALVVVVVVAVLAANVAANVAVNVAVAGGVGAGVASAVSGRFWACCEKAPGNTLRRYEF